MRPTPSLSEKKIFLGERGAKVIIDPDTLFKAEIKHDDATVNINLNPKEVVSPELRLGLAKSAPVEAIKRRCALISNALEEKLGLAIIAKSDHVKFMIDTILEIQEAVKLAGLAMIAVERASESSSSIRINGRSTSASISTPRTSISATSAAGMTTQSQRIVD